MEVVRSCPNNSIWCSWQVGSSYIYYPFYFCFDTYKFQFSLIQIQLLFRLFVRSCVCSFIFLFEGQTCPVLLFFSLPDWSQTLSVHITGLGTQIVFPSVLLCLSKSLSVQSVIPAVQRLRNIYTIISMQIWLCRSKLK